MDCCENKSQSGIKQGVLYGIIPHIGCIAFIIGNIFGIAFLGAFFRPILVNKNFFYFLILISVALTTISAIVYLKKNSSLSPSGIKQKKKYLLTLYGITILTNTLFFFVIFPMVVNVNSINGFASANDYNGDFSILKIKAEIPCSGHASLIIGELKNIKEIKNIKFEIPNYFIIKYDNSAITKTQILSAEIFKEFPAEEVK